jgi:hypothetical protein
MGLNYLQFQLPGELLTAKKPSGRLLMLESDPIPMHADHLRSLVAGSAKALAAIIDVPVKQLGRIRHDPKPVCNVTPDIVVEAGKRLEVIEVMVERPHGLTKARRFDKALGTDRLQSESVRQALSEAGFDDLRVKTSMVTIVAPDFTPAQQSAALRLGFRLRQMVLTREEGTGNYFFVVGSPKDTFPTEIEPSVNERLELAQTIADEVRRFLAATEWRVDEPQESLVRAHLELPGRNEPIDVTIRPLISSPKGVSSGLLVEMRIQDGTRAVDARKIEFDWQEGLPIRCTGYRLWWTVISLDGGPEHSIPRLLFPIREIHDAVEAARVT